MSIRSLISLNRHNFEGLPGRLGYNVMRGIPCHVHNNFHFQLETKYLLGKAKTIQYLTKETKDCLNI